ncbi:MAG: hypothetical protein H0T14_04920 [Nocardioidaceae bacterium]|nr:hypothetical protein [Nocardioidaceae bacterium]
MTSWPTTATVPGGRPTRTPSATVDLPDPLFPRITINRDDKDPTVDDLSVIRALNQQAKSTSTHRLSGIVNEAHSTPVIRMGLELLEPCIRASHRRERALVLSGPSLPW